MSLNSTECKSFHSNSSKNCVLKCDFEYPKELHELQNEYPLPLDKVEIKKSCLIIN